jgi:O-antigen/teichoic acid export membrane protein
MIGRTGVSLAIRLAGIGLGFLALMVLVRALGPAEFGLWSWALEVVALACVASGLGLNQIAVRVVPDCLVTRDAAGLRRFIGAGLLAGLGGSLALALAGAAAWWLGLTPEGIDLRLAGLMALLLVIFTALRFVQEVVRGSERIVLAQAGEQLVWPLALLCMALTLWLTAAGQGGAGLLLGAQVVVFAALGVGLAMHGWRLADRILLPASRHQPGAGEYLAGGLPLAVSATLSLFLKRGDLIVLGALGTAHEVAFYTPASRYAALLVLGQAAASMAFAPRMRVLWCTGDRAGLQACLDRMAAISVLFALPLALAFWLVPAPLMALFGGEFIAAVGVLQVLALGQMVNCWTGPIACAVVACDLERPFAVMTAGAAALLLVLLALLVPRFGMIGAAGASLAGIAFLNLGMAGLIWRQTGLVCWARPAGFAGLWSAARQKVAF